MLLSTTQTLVEWYSFCTLMGIGIAASSLVPASMLIAPWFSKQRGLAVGVINAGVGLGGYIFPKVATRLITTGWLLAGVSDPQRVPRDPAGGHAGSDPKSPDGGSHNARHSIANAGGILSNPVFWIFGMSLFFAAHTLTGVQENLVLDLRGQGVKPPDAAQALSTLLGSSALGKLLGGAAADRFSSRVSMLLANLCLILGLGGLLASDPHSTAMYFSAAMFGLGFGGIFNAPSLIAFEYFGTERVGTILGLYMMFFGVGTSTGGVVAGAIFDRNHHSRQPSPWTCYPASWRAFCCLR